MQIRTKLTLQFLLWGTLIMVIASLAIFYSSYSFRKEDFENRLRNKAKSTARLLLDSKEIDPNRVLKIDKDNPINLENEKIIILNFLNDVVYSSDSTGEIKILNSILERIRLMEQISYQQGQYQVVGTLYIAKFDRFVVLAAATDTEGSYYLMKLKLILTIVCFISLFLFSIAGWIYSGRALKPITNVIKKVETISITSLNLRVPALNETDEIGRLAKTFNKMLERLEASFAVQKDFIANASHELRTPLTAINGQLEVLMMKDRSSEEYKAVIGSVLDDITSLINLSNRLLLIARTSSESYSYVALNKKVRIDEVLWQVREETKKYNNDYQINITLGDSLTDSDHLVVIGDESLLKIALSNIIDNACKYSPDHSVDIKIERPGQNLELIFRDQGIGISEADLQKVFEPFFRAANVKEYRGSGIGLQLVSQIIKNHNGTIKLSSHIGKGTSVNIVLPSIL